jgi:predicted dehydrogenase
VARTDLAVGVFGVGALGRHHTRILATLPGARLVGIYDANPETARAVGGEHGARVFAAHGELAREIEAAVVAVPTVAHREVAGDLLGRGIHVLVEKPIAVDLAEADELIAAARAAGRVLAVGHVEFFNPAVEALVALGLAPRFVEIERLGVFSPRSLDVDVLLDLMIHDLQILHALDPSVVLEIRATGIAVLSERIDIANVRLELASGLVANLTASRVSAEKTRKLRAFFRNRYLSLDYQAQEIKGFRLEQQGEQRRIVPADVAVEKAEPLRRELEGFVAAARGQPARIVSGEEGRRALATALAVVEAARGVC